VSRTNTFGLESGHELVLAMIEYLGDTYGDEVAVAIRAEDGRFIGSRERPIAHGTRAGYQAETRRGIEHCRECLDANTADFAARRATRDARVHARSRVNSLRQRLGEGRS